MDADTAKKKIQKLIAFGRDGRGNEAEMERALAQAEALMRKFGLEEADCVGTDAPRGFNWSSQFAPYGDKGKPSKSLPDWYQFLVTGIAAFTDTIVRQHYRKDRGYGAGFYGEEGDVAFAVWLAEYLKRSIWHAAQRSGFPSGTAREDFRVAMACRLAERARALRAERNAAFGAGAGTALVVVDRKLAERNAHFGAPEYGTGQVRYRNGAAVRAGERAGDKLGLHRPLGGATASAGALK